MKSFRIAVVGLILSMPACTEDTASPRLISNSEKAIRELLSVPVHFKTPRIPDFNKPTAEKIELGRYLFYDTRLSTNGKQSCASCHIQKLAFSDGLTTSLGSTGQTLPRNSQGLGNAIYHSTLTWANNSFTHLEDQLKVPLQSDNPIELGVTEQHANQVLSRFNLDPHYQSLFKQAFPNSDSGATLQKIIFALASFCRTLISGNSPYDQYLLGDKTALTPQQLLGYQLFNGEKFECYHCHTGVNFSVAYIDNNSNPYTTQFSFFNNGLYNLDDSGSYPKSDQGLYDLTLKDKDKGFFRPQSLRNVALTAPYMHDGSIPTLRQVLEHYARGGTKTEQGSNAGDGRLNPLKSGFVRGFDATDEEINAVLAFLHALTDTSFINNPRLSNPFSVTTASTTKAER